MTVWDMINSGEAGKSSVLECLRFKLAKEGQGSEYGGLLIYNLLNH